MDRHERCLAAIANQPVDRAPRYLPAMACEVAGRILGREVATGTGSLHYAETCAAMQGEQAHAEFEAQLLETMAELYRTLDIDVYRIPWRHKQTPALQVDACTFVFGDPDGDHTVYRYAPDSGDFAPVRTVYKQTRGPEQRLLESVEAAEADIEAGGLDRIALPSDYVTACQRWGEAFFVVSGVPGISVGLSEDDLMMVVLEPELVARKTMVQAAQAMAFMDRLAETAYPKVLMGGGDLAGNAGPMYSPESFRRITLPALKLVAEHARDLGMQYVFRTDGDIWAISDMIFNEAGCAAYGEVDRLCGMTVEAVRRRYPELVVWGNMPSALVKTESAARVRDEAARCIAESGGTGYFNGCSNAILTGTPVENVEAMFSL